MLLGTLGASLFGNILTGKEIYRARKDKGINRASEGIVRAVYGNKKVKKNKKQTIKWIFNTTSSFNKL